MIVQRCLAAAAVSFRRALMGRQWVPFAATGAPDEPSAWPRWDPAGEAVLVFGPGVGISATVPAGRLTAVSRFPRGACTFLDPFPAALSCSDNVTAASGPGGNNALLPSLHAPSSSPPPPPKDKRSSAQPPHRGGTAAQFVEIYAGTILAAAAAALLVAGGVV